METRLLIRYPHRFRIGLKRPGERLLSERRRVVFCAEMCRNHRAQATIIKRCQQIGGGVVGQVSPWARNSALQNLGLCAIGGQQRAVVIALEYQRVHP